MQVCVFCACPPSHPVFKKYAALPLAVETQSQIGESDAEGLAPPSTGRLDRPEGRVFTVGQKEGCRR